MYTLYYSPGAASLLPHVLLLEIGAAHELALVDIASGANRQPDYLRLNPNGVIPTLVVDGRPCLETAALLLLLTERHPEAGLAPAAGDGDRFVLTGAGDIVEIQATGEKRGFTQGEFEALFAHARKGIAELMAIQRAATA